MNDSIKKFDEIEADYRKILAENNDLMVKRLADGALAILSVLREYHKTAEVLKMELDMRGQVIHAAVGHLQSVALKYGAKEAMDGLVEMASMIRSSTAKTMALYNAEAVMAEALGKCRD